MGQTYHASFAASGGHDSTYTWALAAGTALPAGITLSAAGELSGTPTATGNYAFTVTVDGAISKPFTLRVRQELANTGVPAGQLFGAGLGLLLVGALLLLTRRRERRRPGH